MFTDRVVPQLTLVHKNRGSHTSRVHRGLLVYNWLKMSWKVTFAVLLMLCGWLIMDPACVSGMVPFTTETTGTSIGAKATGVSTDELQALKGREYLCVPDFQCRCFWNTADQDGNSSTLYTQVICDVTNADLDALMTAIPPTNQILLTCSDLTGNTSHHIRNVTLWKHVSSLKQLQLLYCSVDITADAFTSLTSLQIVDIFYTSLTPRNLPAFGKIQKNADEILVHLQTNHLTYLPEYAFGVDREKYITTLSLSYNNMETVYAGALLGMGHLQKLYLNNNDLTIIQNASFEGCNVLEILHLQQNNIRYIETGALSPLRSLRVLNIQWNRIEYLDADTFSGMAELRYLNLSHNSITSLPGGIFDDLTSLQELRFDWNSIVSLQPMAHSPAWMHMNLLNISHNALRDVTPFLLQTKMPNLVHVDFSYNNIIQLRRGDVTGLTLLETMDFRNNSLSFLEWESVADMPALLTADFRFNNLSSVPESFIDRFIVEKNRERPISLLMAGNPFSCGCFWALYVRIQHDVFYPVVLSDIDDYVCQTPSQLMGQHFIQLARKDFWCPVHPCVIQGCDCYNQTASKKPIISCRQKKAVSNLVKLPVTTVIFECSSCLIPEYPVIPDNSFSGLQDLQTLRLSGNNLTRIAPGTFSDLLSLQILNLENNDFSEIPASEMTSLTSLVEVDFHGNKLISIDVDMFSSSPNLVKVDLSGNVLSTFPDGIFNLTENLESVRLYDNPLVCKCSLLWLKHWMQEHFRIVERMNEVRCVTNQSDVWVPVVEVPDDEFGCSNSSDVITQIVAKQDHVLWISMSSLVAVFIILTFVIFRYRYPIQVLLYTRVGLHFIHNDVDNDGFVYDAYLAYSDSNIQEAIQIVATRLEARAPPYVLCLRHRDFPIGDSMGATIVEFINTSKRTILFLSADFLENEWCSLEFRAAHAQSLRDKTNRVVIIILDEVQPDLLDEDLKLYMFENDRSVVLG